ncbi:class I SAM-dependent methyltransferase [Luteimonas vadosa]|uniref:Methyltransferase type 12 domain-containing protein n=1 Tax=Luteimonas vadosa TaxID=1165507 RepID=A0ABP9DN05_9GAMM
MVSFLPPGAETALDAIDYDTVYKVDALSSDRLYAQCRRFLGDLLPARVDSYLEVGAGTGLFTLGYLSAARPQRALITDISPKMLDVCRQRLASRAIAEESEVSYALWDGTVNCFAPGTFDLITGFSVLHHILDYQDTLAILQKALAPGGRAIFLEPSAAFHRALVDLVAEVNSALPIGVGGWTTDHQAQVAAWIAENYVNIKYPGDGLALELREDKHLFDPAALHKAAANAGFGQLRIIPFADEQEAWSALSVYAGQLGLPPECHRLFLARCAAMMPGPFAYLSAADRAPSFLLVFQQEAAPDELAPTGPRASGPVFRHPCPHFRYDIAVEVREGAAGDSTQAQVTASGWVLGDAEVQYVQLERIGTARFPVAGMRLDVATIMNADRRYPPARAMCSGLNKTREQYIEGLPGDAIRVIIATVDGGRHEIGRIPPGQATARITSLVSPPADMEADPGAMEGHPGDAGERS